MPWLRKLGTTKSTEVDAHFRTVAGEPVFVRQHEREVETSEADLKEVQLRSRQAKELELWKAWIAGGKKPEDLRPLIESFRPLLQSRAKVFKGRVRISDAAIDAEYLKQAVQAFLHYDPSKGSLGTFLWAYLAKVKRFINKNQNIARIPEGRIYKIHEFQIAQQEMEARLGRPATDIELAGYMGWNLSEVGRMSKELVKDLWTHGFVEDPSSVKDPVEENVLRFIGHELTEDEKVIFKHLVHRSKDGSLEFNPAATPAMLAKTTGFTPYKVSHVKKAIAKKIAKWLKTKVDVDHLGLEGIPLAIRDPKGTIHSGIGGEGKYWRRESTHDYATVAGAKGIDGEDLGAFVGPGKNPPRSYVVHQLTTGLDSYDKDVLFLGFNSEEEVRQAYLENARDSRRLGAVTSISTRDLQSRVKAGGLLTFITEKKAEELAKQIQALRGGGE